MSKEIPAEVLLSPEQIKEVNRKVHGDIEVLIMPQPEDKALCEAQASYLINEQHYLSPEEVQELIKAERERIIKALDTPSSHDSEAYHYVVIKQSDWEALKQGKSDICHKCHKPLVVPQHLDYVEIEGQKYCIGCGKEGKNERG